MSARVVLVGRTGLEGSLRRDGRVDLVRVRDPLEAISELSDPADSETGQSVVIVGPEVDLGAEGEGRGAAAFIAALRRVEPRVRVLRLNGTSSQGASDGVFDAVVRAAPSEAELNAAVFGVAARPALEAPAPEVAPLVEPADAEGAADATGDGALVRLLLCGQDPCDAAVGLIRSRSGASDVAFVPAGADAGAPPGGVPVAWRGRVLGSLRSAAAGPERLAPHAAWLASWLVLRDQQAQLREAAFVDPLTGAHNRRYFEYFLGRALEEARMARRPLTVLVFDIDDFKRFNDDYGHAAGDEILRQTVALLKSLIRPTDRVCRIGGDEFAVIFYDPSGPRDPARPPPSDVFGIAHRFRQAICEQRFPKLGEQAPGTLTVSGGLATYPWDGRTAEELLRQADELALRSKREGKNAITLGPGAMRECMPPREGGAGGAPARA